MVAHSCLPRGCSEDMPYLSGAMAQLVERDSMNRVHFSSASSEWETPKDFFDVLNDKFGFTRDVCATAENRKCDKFFSLDEDGLAQSWSGDRCWMNPPYGREIVKWVAKAHAELVENGVLTVGLLPARTDTKWWHEHVAPFTVRFVPGRLKFGGSKNCAPFPSAICVWW